MWPLEGEQQLKLLYLISPRQGGYDTYLPTHEWMNELKSFVASGTDVIFSAANQNWLLAKRERMPAALSQIYSLKDK